MEQFKNLRPAVEKVKKCVGVRSGKYRAWRTTSMLSVVVGNIEYGWGRALTWR